MKIIQLFIAFCAALATFNFVSPKVAKAAFHAETLHLNEWQETFTPKEKSGWKNTAYNYGYEASKGSYVGIKYGIPLTAGLGLLLIFNLVQPRTLRYSH